VSNKDVKQDALDNLADALTEDILNTPDDELLREVEEDYGDPRALANKFHQILERAENQVFGTARSAASPQVRSSVLDLPTSLPDETVRWVKGIFDLGSRVSEFLSSLTPRTLAWSATAAAVVILVQAAVITAVLVKEQGASSVAEGPIRDRLGTPEPAMAAAPTVTTSPRDHLGPLEPPGGAGIAQTGQGPPPSSASEPPVAPDSTVPWQTGGPLHAEQNDGEAVTSLPPVAASPAVAASSPRLSDEKIAALVAGGRQLMVAGDIPNARLLLQQAAEAGNAAAALELGATYDPTFLPPDMPNDRWLARLWYEKAEALGSTEAAVRLERPYLRDIPFLPMR
jgi:hypothetical protein